MALVLLCARVAAADAPGAEALANGIRALEGKQYKEAQRHFEAALSRGGLGRAQTLTAYIDLGVTLVALGKTAAAERAFAQAALIDPQFGLPPRSGSAAQKIASAAKKRQEENGAYHFDVGVPGEVKPGEPFRVTVEMTEDQAQLAPLVRFSAKEPSGNEFETVEPAAAKVEAQIPADVAQSGATVSLRFELLDSHDNRLAAIDKQVHVAERASDLGPRTSAKEPPKPPEPEARSPKPEAPPPPSEAAEGGDEDAAESGPWSIPHGSKKYTAVRTDHAPAIDGVLDDPIWATAPKDDRFLSTKSKPFGKPTREPTIVQLAYDEQNLYVAFRCTYAKPHPPSDAYASDEQTLLAESEYVAVVVDAVHGHSGGYEFAVSPAGVRADAELGDQGATQNLDWHGIWDVATHATDDGWTAEFAIPWGTMYMPSSDEAFDIGINFQRREPESGEVSLWTLHPPATELFDTNFFGHVDGLARVHPGQRLLLLPYVALGFDSTTPMMQSQLSDLTGTNASGRLYAGAYLRLRPPGPFRLDATFNPDFSAVTPDAAIANYDRFELEYPEVRAFFSEDNPRFQFGGTRYFYGDLGAQLFYSRRLGIATSLSGLTEILPILWGVKSVLRDGGTEAALMNVETVKPQTGISFADNATVGRVTETIEGQRVGAAVLACGACALDGTGAATQSYASGGADAQITAFERHLTLSGFYNASRSGETSGAAGEGTVGWKSQDVYAKATLLDITHDFQAPLGYFPITGVRAETIAAGYTPVVRSDLVQQVFIDTQLATVRDRTTDDLVYRRGVIAAGIQTIDGAVISANVQPATEHVVDAFPIGNGRIMVAPGTYKVLGTQFDLTSPPDRTFVYGIHYLGGDLFEGTRRAPGVMVGVNLGRFTARGSYTLYILNFQDQMQSFYGHDALVSASYAYTPLARTAIVLEADTVAARATAQATTTIQFGQLSAATLSVRANSGSTFDTPANNVFDHPSLTAILSLQLGLSPL